MNRALLLSAVGLAGERKATDTNFAASRRIAVFFLGKALTAGRVAQRSLIFLRAPISGARLDGRALPSRTSLALSVAGLAYGLRPGRLIQRLRKVGVAPELAGRIKPAVPHNDERQRVSGFDSVISPSQPPAQFFPCPHQPRSHRHAQNCRGLRLLWLFRLNGGLR